MESKAKIIEENGAYRYFDRNGKELHDGDTRTLTIDAGGLKALIRYYETHNTDLEGTDDE